MRGLLRSLRVRFVALAFAAIYLPVVVLFIVTFATEETTTDVSGEVAGDGVAIDEEVEVFETSGGDLVVETGRVAVPVWITAILLAPVAAAAAWWLSGRAVRPVEEAVAVQGRLVEEASHEMRTPLAVLVNNAEILLDHPEPTIELYRQGIERSGTAARRLSDTIDALLVDARGRARSLTRLPLDVATVAAGVVDDVQAVAQRRSVTVSASTAPTLGTASTQAPVDEASLTRAVANLVTNAIEHAPEGGAVQVEVRGGDGEVAVVVTDDGPGVAPTDHARIFDRFWTGRPEGGGTGLGLALGRQIAEAHGGTVTVASPVADGRGARFTLTVRR
ncbi:MAG: HAMP domain-containing sensor histidine kinase [Actinomycetota bacterium]